MRSLDLNSTNFLPYAPCRFFSLSLLVPFFLSKCSTSCLRESLHPCPWDQFVGIPPELHLIRNNYCLLHPWFPLLTGFKPPQFFSVSKDPSLVHFVLKLTSPCLLFGKWSRSVISTPSPIYSLLMFLQTGFCFPPGPEARLLKVIGSSWLPSSVTCSRSSFFLGFPPYLRPASLQLSPLQSTCWAQVLAPRGLPLPHDMPYCSCASQFCPWPSLSL